MISKEIKKLVDYYKGRTKYEDLIIYSEKVLELQQILWDTKIVIISNDMISNKPCVYLHQIQNENILNQYTNNLMVENSIWLNINDFTQFKQDFMSAYYG